MAPHDIKHPASSLPDGAARPRQVGGNFILSPWRLPLIVALLVLLLDLGTKMLVVRTMDVGEVRPLVESCFFLVHYRNSGAAWGILQGQSRLLGFFSLLVVVALVWKFADLVEGRWERAMALALVVGGTLGNLHDRLIYGEVVDFLLFFFRSYQWPAFNVADAAICCGVAWFIGSSLFLSRRPDSAA